jgi:excisionase family DNA binding protein
MNRNKITLEELLEQFPETSKKVDEIYNLISNMSSHQIPKEESIYTLLEAAHYLKMAEPTLRLYLKNGDITGSRLGKRWLFQQADLDKFLERFLVPSVHDLKEGGRHA